MNAAGYSDATEVKGAVIGLAIGALSLTVFLNMVSRRAGIYLNNIFAVLKVAVLLAIIVLGFVKASGVNLGGQPKATSNFDPDTSFKPGAAEAPSVTDSLLYVVYTYSGFEQPFYVLTEVRTPRKVFPRYTFIAMVLATTLFLLTNVAYFCAVPQDLPAIREQRNMATVFFSQMFGNEAAKRVMDAIIAVSIFGNLLVMTFTASRVKQEIAKEGILPFSLMLATSHRTLDALWQARRLSREGATVANETLEQSPMAALLLHWMTSVALIAFTAMVDPAIAYSVLVTLYSYVIVTLNGFFTSLGLLYLKMHKQNRDWTNPNFNPRFGAVYAAVYFVACGVMLFTAFAPPSESSPYSYTATSIKWYLLPAIGLSVPLWGAMWYLGLRLVMFLRVLELVVERNPTTALADEDMPDQYIVTIENITHDWRRPQPREQVELDGF